MNVDPVYHTQLLELRSMKDFAAICQFMNMFHPAFALEDFETEVNLILRLQLLSVPTWHHDCAPSLAVDPPAVMLERNTIVATNSTPDPFFKTHLQSPDQLHSGRTAFENALTNCDSWLSLAIRILSKHWLIQVHRHML